jgi:hypothetical protein
LFSKLFIEFETFILPVYYSSRNERKIEERGLSKNTQDLEDKDVLSEEVTNKDLADLKKYLTRNPLERLTDSEKKILFKCREHYQTIPAGLQLFLRSVDWNRPVLVNECYKILENWAPMLPDEAISLLDAKFPDD